MRFNTYTRDKCSHFECEYFPFKLCDKVFSLSVMPVFNYRKLYVRFEIPDLNIKVREVCKILSVFFF